MMSLRFVTSLAVLATAVLAKTDLVGCISSDSVFTPSQGTPYATRVWYVPETGEICAALDCGGGRAPPKTTVPGCPSYEGTETYSPSFLPVKTSAAAVVQTTQPSVTTPAPSSIISAAGSSAAAGDADKAESQTESETWIRSNGPVVTGQGGSVTAATTANASGSGNQASQNGGSATSAATSGTTNSPNAAAPTGASREMFGLLAGVALGAALL